MADGLRNALGAEDGAWESTGCYRATRSTKEITRKAFSDVAERNDALEACVDVMNADVGAANVVVLGSEVGYYLPVLLVAGEGRERVYG